MNTERMQMMLTMLKEVQAGTWKPSVQAEPDGTKTFRAEVGFNMDTWVSDRGDCGFAACAVGHACLDKRFNDLGLRFSTLVNAPAFDADEGSEEYFSGWSAVINFFGITSWQSYHLFNPHYYRDEVEDKMVKVTIEQVIARIEKLLAEQAAADGKLLKDLDQ